MEIITVQCPKCFGQLQIDKSGKQYFCLYCRTGIKEKPKAREQIELEGKLRFAKQIEKLYYRNQKTFDDVMNAYDQAERFGKEDSNYWLERARFFVKGSLRELSRTQLSVGNNRSRIRVSVSDREKVVDQYIDLIDIGVRYDQDNKEEIEAEKKKTIDKINATFDVEGKRKLEEEEKDAQLKTKIKRMHKKRRTIIIALGLIVGILVFLIAFALGYTPLDVIYGIWRSVWHLPY